MKDSSELLSDFWWLPKNATIDELTVGVGHHKEIADNEDVPPLESWYRSLTPEGHLSKEVKYYSINLFNAWRSACHNTNIYRTLKVFRHNAGGAIFLGPFLVDIDNEEDLGDAQTVTKQVVKYLTTQLTLSLDDLRTFFSGHKGFNIEIRPDALRISGSLTDQIRLSSNKLDNIIAYIRSTNNVQDSGRNVVSAQGTVIDRIYGDRFGYGLRHPYIRLHGSINKWIRGNGKAITRRRIEITYEEVLNKSTKEILTESERQANLF